MARLVQVDKRDDQLFVIPYFRSVDGIYVQKEPIHQILASDVDNVGRTVLRALDEFETGLPTPDWRMYRGPVYLPEKFKDWSHYLTGLVACHIEQHDDRTEVFPLKVIRGSLVGVEEESVSIPTPPEPRELGKAVLIALTKQL